MAEDERQRIVKLANDGRLPRPVEPDLDASQKQQKEALQHLLAGESARALGKSYKVHHATPSLD